MKTSEILERLASKTMHENTPEGFVWAQQLAKDLHNAVRALENIKGHRELTILENTKGSYDFDIKSTEDYIWRIADKVLKEIDL